MSWGCTSSKPTPSTCGTRTTGTISLCSGGSTSCAAKLPFMVNWSKACTPYPKGSIVIHGDCVWAQTAGMGEYAPPGTGQSGWRPYDQVALVNLLVNPASVLLPLIKEALADPSITSTIQLETCNVQ